MDKKGGWFEEWLRNNNTYDKDREIKGSNNKPFKGLKPHKETYNKNINNTFTRTVNTKFDTTDKHLFQEWIDNSSKKIIDKDTSLQRKYKYTDKNTISIDKSIDLHNLTVYEALNTLKHFLISAYRQNISTVLIIHGKGKHSEDNKPKIKNAVIDYLSKEGKQFIFQFKEAPNKYGGKGATVIWLKH